MSRYQATKYDLLRLLRLKADITVSSIEELYAIPTYRRKWGVLVAVYREEDLDVDTDLDADADDDDTTGLYHLVYGLSSTDIRDNGNWRKFIGIGITDVYVEDHDTFPQIEYLRIVRDQSDDEVITLLKKPEGIMTGFNVAWFGEGLSFIVGQGLFYMNGRLHKYEGTDAEFPLELDAAPTAPDSRIDVIAVEVVVPSPDADGNMPDEPWDSVVVIVKGEAAPTPMKPTTDPLTQIEITHLLLPAGATSYYDYVEEDLIYDENVEWDTESSDLGVDFEALTDPYKGLKHVGVPANPEETVSLYFKPSPKKKLDGYGVLVFHIKLQEPVGKDFTIQIAWVMWHDPHWYHRSKTVFARKYIQLDYTGWQAVVIPMTEFEIDQWLAQYGYLDDGYEGLRFNIGSGSPGFYLDYMKLAGGISQPIIEDEIRLIGDVTGEGRVGGEIPTTLAQITEGATKGGENKTIEITYDSKGRVVSVTEFFLSGAEEIRFRVDDGTLQYTYVPEEDTDEDEDDEIWTDIVDVPPHTELKFEDGGIYYRNIPVGVDPAAVVWVLLVDLTAFIEDFLGDEDSDFDFDDTFVTDFDVTPVDTGTMPSVTNTNNVLRIRITQSDGTQKDVSLGGLAGFKIWSGAEGTLPESRNSDTIYFETETEGS